MLTPGTSQGGLPVQIENANGTVINPAVGFAIPPFDAIVPTFNSTSDVWVYKTGGVSGTTVATITISYTDSTKAVISSVVKT